MTITLGEIDHATVTLGGETYVLRVDRRFDGIEVRVYDRQRRGWPLLGPPKLFPFVKPTEETP